MDMINYDSEEHQKLEKLIEELKIGMLTTITSGQELKSRPMMAQHFDSKKNEIWFFTGHTTGKIADIEKNPHVHLSFSDSSDSTFLSICAEARIVEDEQLKKKLWNPLLLAWFPDGLEDPEVTLLCVKIHTAEYWDASSKLVQLVGFAKALLTGESYQPDKSEHGRLTLN